MVNDDFVSDLLPIEPIKQQATQFNDALPAFSQHYKPRQYFGITELCQFARCPRKFMLSVGCRLTSSAAGEDGHIALKFGEAIHAGLPFAFFGDLEESLRRFMFVWKDRVGDDKRNIQRAIAMFSQYHDARRDNRSIYQIISPPNGLLKITNAISEYEVPYAIDIGLSVPIMSRVDFICQHRDTGELFGGEFKTSSEVSARFFDSFTFNPQICAATLALRAYKLACKGTIVEAIRVSKTNAECMCSPYYVTDSMLQDFITWAHWIGGQILACERAMYFPKNIAACTPYPEFGQPGYQCEYMPMCLAENWLTLRDAYSVRAERPMPFDLPPIAKEIANVTDEHITATPASQSTIPSPVPCFNNQRPDQTINLPVLATPTSTVSTSLPILPTQHQPSTVQPPSSDNVTRGNRFRIPLG